MHDRSPLSRTRNLMLATVCAVAVAGAACAASPRSSHNGSGGTSASGGSAAGGRGGQGGVSAGGSSASGGKGAGGSSASGGAANGGSAGGGASGSGVDAAAGGGLGGLDGGPSSSDAPIPMVLGCVMDTDCPSGRNCSGGSCVQPKACYDSLECGSTDLVCDPNRGFCVQCTRQADCANGLACVSNRCSGAAKCQTSIDCGLGKVCDPSGRCVECSKNTDCSATQRCVQNACRAACDSDKDCTPQGMLCNFALGVCTQCSSQQSCPAGSSCDGSGMCKMAVCLPGESMCSGNGIASCKPDGTGFGTVSVCPATRSCRVFGGVATCGELPTPVDAGPTVDGGEALDGGSPIVIGPRSCGVPFSASPCTSLPNLVVTQTIDGKGDEFCDVPAFHLNAETAKAAGKVVVYNATPPEDATVKVAWSSAGVAVFVDVRDASVQTVNEVDPNQAIDKVYQGDSIELFIASSNDVTGAPGSDSNTLHVTIPADGPAVQVKTTTSNGATSITHSRWPSDASPGAYKQVKTATGYAIEAQLPWSGNVPLTGSLVRFDIGLNSADKNSDIEHMRDGQLIYYVGQVTTSTCQSSDGTVPFCDDRTWCTTQLQ